MKFNVADCLKQPGKTGEYHQREPYGPLDHLGRELVFIAPLSLDVKYSYDGNGFTVTGRASTVLKSECSKCAKEFDEPFSFEFEERFEKAPDEESDNYPFTGEELDISQMVLDNLLLELPVYSQCSPDCKGLCPVCGCDLNTAQCDCARGEDEDNPFAALKALLDNDKEV